MCKCQSEDCNKPFIYGDSDVPCWFLKLDKVETKMGNFHFCDVYVNDKCYRLRQGDVVTKEKLGL